MAGHAIELTAPVEWFEKSIARVYLREPKARHLFKYGEPRFPVMQNDGASYFVERDDVVSRYIEDLLSLDGDAPVDGGASAFMGQLSLQDGIALRDALFVFFTDARAATFRKKPTA